MNNSIEVNMLSLVVTQTMKVLIAVIAVKKTDIIFAAIFAAIPANFIDLKSDKPSKELAQY